MIHTNRIVTVGEQECIIDRPIVLYRGDREVEIEFTLVGNEFMFSEEGNVIKSVNASHGQLVLNTPSGEHMFSELAECHEGKVVFVVTKEMIDEFIEMGFYSFQIRLYDSAEMKSRVTIPPVMNGFDIRNPIAAEDETNVVDQGIVDYARIFKDQSNEELPTFDWTGAYNKTEWVHHDVITENKLNKIEDAIYSINANIKESDVVMLNALDNVKKDADKYVKEHMAEVEQDVEDFERNLNTGVEKFKVDTNAAMTAHKNEVSEVVDELSRKNMRVINVEMYPTLGDAILEASNNPYSTLYFPVDRTTNETINIPCKTNVKMDGCLILDTNLDIPCMVIGDAEDRNNDVELNIRVKRKTIADWNSEASINDVGVKIYNLWSSLLNVIHCEQFNTGIQLIGHKQGVAHNIVNLSNIFLNRIHLELVSEETSGFVNENVFNGGRFTSNYGLSDYAALEKVGIKMTNAGGNSFNNNVFVKPCFQIGANGYGIDWYNARMNTVIAARVEESDYIARFDKSCELNDIQIGYQTSLNIPHVDYSDTKTNYITHLRNIDKDKNSVLLASYNDLTDRCCRFNTSGPSYNLTSLSLARFVADATINHCASGVGVEGNYLTLNGTVIGNKVDTSKVKSFKICKDTAEGYEGWVVIQCYDANGNILDGSSTRVFGSNKKGEKFSYVTTMKGCYRTSSAANEVSFTVSDETHSIWFGIGTSTVNTMKVRSFAIYGQQYCSVYKGSANVKDYICAENTPTNPPIGRDRIIYKYGTITDYYGWIWNGTSWLKLMIGTTV